MLNIKTVRIAEIVNDGVNALPKDIAENLSQSQRFAYYLSASQLNCNKLVITENVKNEYVEGVRSLFKMFNNYDLTLSVNDKSAFLSSMKNTIERFEN